MALTLIYRMFTTLLRWMQLCTRSDATKEIEILVLRHQLAVLQRRTARPRMCWDDRAVITALRVCSRHAVAWVYCSPFSVAGPGLNLLTSTNPHDHAPDRPSAAEPRRASDEQ